MEPSSRANPASGSWYEGARGFSDALAEQRRSSRPMVVYFFTTWCGYCRRLDSQILPAPAMQAFLAGTVNVKIDAEAGPDEGLLARRFGASGWPAFYVVPPNGGAPSRVHPFILRGGAPYQMTPREFAATCEDAAHGS